MKQYKAIEKNGSGVLFFTAENSVEAGYYMEETVHFPDDWFWVEIDEVE